MFQKALKNTKLQTLIDIIYGRVLLLLPFTI